MRVAAPPKFKVLVANLAGSSDYSLNMAPPTKLRTGFVLQMLHTPGGVTRINGPTQQPPPVSLANNMARIQVSSANYWDPTVAPPGPFYYQEECRAFDQYPQAASDFGVGEGSGTGPVNTVASELANWINLSVQGVSALSVGDTVYMTTNRVDPVFPVQATNDMSVLLGGGAVIFTVKDGAGNTLNVAGQRRRSFYLPKTVKSQAAPTILP
jgi:hypothetical protein